MGKGVSPNRIIETVDENFNDVLSRPSLKNLALVAIAISLAEKLKISEIARHMPNDEKIRCGIIGHGATFNFGCMHANWIDLVSYWMFGLLRRDKGRRI